MSNELAIRNMDDAARLSKALADSGFYKDAKSPAQALVKVAAGIELGITPLAAMSGLHIVEGKVTMGSGLVASQVQRSGKFRTRIITRTDKRCEIKFQEKEGDQWLDLNPNAVFTWEDAVRAELTHKANWKKYPADMLFARAMTQGARMHTAQVFGGPIYTPEEMGKENTDAEGNVIDTTYQDVTNQTPPPAEQPAAATTPPAKNEPPKREMPSAETMKQLQTLTQSLALTEAERKSIRNDAGLWDKAKAEVEVKNLKNKIAALEMGPSAPGQMEYVDGLMSANEKLFTPEEILKTSEGIRKCETFREATEKIVKIMGAVNERKKKAQGAKPAETKKPEPPIQDAVVVGDGPTDDADDNDARVDF